MYLIIIFCVFILLIFWVFNFPVFGQQPKGNNLAKIKALPNYKDSAIQNLVETPTKPDHVTYYQMINRMLKGNPNATPKQPIPVQQPNFARSIDLKLTWFGHSSYLIQVDGLNILIDPVFSERTSPFQFIGTKNFLGTDFIAPKNLPPLDIVLITHDHYDHLDYQTILALKEKTALFVTSLGVGAHLIRWGIKPEFIIELAWHEQASPLAAISFTAQPARHFSGRKFKRNQTAWSSFILKTKHHNLFLGGDSGYESHFKTIGEKYGPFDLAILECGQYNEMWPYIHMFPEQVTQACLDLNAQKLLPVHWGKFRLALHDWDEPIKRMVESAAAVDIPLLTPQIGQTFTLQETSFKQWWLNL